jgi:hypothetical protein
VAVRVSGAAGLRIKRYKYPAWMAANNNERWNFSRDPPAIALTFELDVPATGVTFATFPLPYLPKHCVRTPTDGGDYA